MITFTLSMPSIGLFGNKWWCDADKYVRVKSDKDVKPEYRNKNYYYNLGSDCQVCVSVSDCLTTEEADKAAKDSYGFFGYDWMINSICKNGDIVSPNRQND